jgi:hypothetical protein
VEHKRETLGRCQRVEHDEQREADRVRQQRLILRRADLWVRQVGAELLLAPGTAGAQDVEADAGDDGGEPGAEVLNVARARPADAQPGVLDGVVGLGEGTEHPVGHGAQMGAALLEAVGQPVLLIHRSHSSVGACHRDRPAGYIGCDAGPKSGFEPKEK